MAQVVVPDSIPAFVVRDRDCRPVLAEPLPHVFHLFSFVSAVFIFSRTLEGYTVIPIPKQGEGTTTDLFRPVMLLSDLSTPAAAKKFEAISNVDFFLKLVLHCFYFIINVHVVEFCVD